MQNSEGEEWYALSERVSGCDIHRDVKYVEVRSWVRRAMRIL